MKSRKKIKFMESRQFIIFLLVFMFMSNSYAKPKVNERQLGVVSHRQSPKTWDVNIPEDFKRVELAVFVKGKDEPNAFSGWYSSMKVNGQYAWRFLRYDNKEGGKIRDYVKNTEVWDKSGNGKWFDVTSFVKAGDNNITFKHNTSGPGIGVKIRVSLVNSTSKELVARASVNDIPKRKTNVMSPGKKNESLDIKDLSDSQWGGMLANSVWQNMDWKEDYPAYQKLHASGNIGLSYDSPDSFYTSKGSKWWVSDGELIIAWGSGGSTTYPLPKNVSKLIKGVWQRGSQRNSSSIKLITSGDSWDKSILGNVQKIKGEGKKTPLVDSSLKDCLEDLSELGADAWHLSKQNTANCLSQLDTVRSYQDYEDKERKTRDLLHRLEKEKNHEKRLVLIQDIPLSEIREKEKAEEKNRYDRELRALDICVGKIIRMKAMPSEAAMLDLGSCKDELWVAETNRKEKRDQAKRLEQKDFERSYEIIEKLQTEKSHYRRRKLAESIPDESMRTHQLSILDKKQSKHRRCLEQLKAYGIIPSIEVKNDFHNCNRELGKLIAKSKSSQTGISDDSILPILAKTYEATRNSEGAIEPAGLPWESGGFLKLYTISIKPSKHTTEIVCKWDLTVNSWSTNLFLGFEVADINTGYLNISAHDPKSGEELGQTVAFWTEGTTGLSVSTDRLAQLERVRLKFSLTIEEKVWGKVWKSINIEKRKSP